MTEVLKENSLITLDEAKGWLGIDVSNTDYDFKLITFINSSSDKIEAYLDRKLCKKEYTARLDGNRNIRLVLRNFPVSSVNSIAVDHKWDFSDPVDPDNYRWSEDGVVTLKQSLLPRGNCNVQVVYEAGYVTPLSSIQTGDTLPSAIKMACIEFVKYLFSLDSDERYGISSRNKQGQSISYASGIPSEIMEMIEDYRRIEFDTTMAALDTF